MLLLQDVRVGWRSLTRTPGFFAVAVSSLVLGIGANTAIFDLLNACLLKTLPAKHPEQLVILTDPTTAGVAIGVSSGARELMSYPEFRDLERMKSLSGLFATESALQRIDANIEGANPETVYTRMVSGNFFSTLGVEPRLGHFFDAQVDDHPGDAPFAILSYEFWQRRFGRSEDVLGKEIKLRQALLTVIGVAPPGFFGESVGSKPDIWLPLSMQKQVRPGRDWLHPQPDQTLKVQWLHVFGRLSPGYSLTQVQSEANLTFKEGLEESYASLSGNAKKRFMDQRIEAKPAAQGSSEVRDQVKQPLLILLGAVGAVLLVCCVNVMNLLLARASTRRREVTTRLALGARKVHLLRQLLTESFVLAAFGSLGGLLLAETGANILTRMASRPNDPIQLDVSPDWRVLLFTAGIAILTTVVFGLAPALRAARTEIGNALRETSAMTASVHRVSLGKLFVAMQVALSLALVVGAGLFMRTLRNMRQVDLGYYRDRLLTMRVDGLAAGYKEQQLLAVYKRLEQALLNAAGVKAVAMSENGLLSTTDSEDRVEVQGYTPHQKNEDQSRWDEVGPGYFSTLEIPILLGREITKRDRPGTPLVCVINQAFAKRFFAGRNPIGKTIATVYGDKRTQFEVIGVAKDTRDHYLRGDVPPRFFAALQQASPEVPESVYFEVRTAGEPSTGLNTLRRVIRATEPNAVILSARSLGELIDDRVRTDRLIARMTSIFGAIALLLAATGIYGVVAYSVSQRTSEIGIRMAIGAEAQNVMAMVLKETAFLLAIGLVAGLCLSVLMGRVISNQLVGVHSADPWVMALSAALFALIGALAGMGPAWRASRIDPAAALRQS
jgi:predicted permease